MSPLMAAARDGFTAIVKVLLAAGADFEQVDGEWTSVCCISCVRKLDPASIMERAQCAPQDCTESSVSCGWQQVCNGSRAALTSMDPPPRPRHPQSSAVPPIQWPRRRASTRPQRRSWSGPRSTPSDDHRGHASFPGVLGWPLHHQEWYQVHIVVVNRAAAAAVAVRIARSV